MSTISPSSTLNAQHTGVFTNCWNQVVNIAKEWIATALVVALAALSIFAVMHFLPSLPPVAQFGIVFMLGAAAMGGIVLSIFSDFRIRF